MTADLSYAWAALCSEPLAIQPDKLRTIAGVLAQRGGSELLGQAIAAAGDLGGDRTAAAGTVQSQVGVLRIDGTISHRPSVFAQNSGGCSYAQIARGFDALLRNPDCGAILLDINSGGGMVHGLEETADRIYAARGGKPIWALANGICCSAAYWLASAADRVLSTPSSLAIGSIGILMAHTERSAANEKDGIATTIVRMPPAKAGRNEYEPLPEEERQHMQATCEGAYDQFVAAVARHRGVSESAVRDGYGRGRELPARVALREGLVDQIASFEQAVGELSALIPPPSAVNAAAGPVASPRRPRRPRRVRSPR